MTETKQIAALDRLRELLRPLREQLVKHQIYHQMETADDLRVFMEHHVFAVWDFMSLLKALQRRLTSVTIPWVPQGDPNARRLINEIVLDEESDDNGEGGYTSHFELYRAAMAQSGANASAIDDFLDRLGRGDPFYEALEQAPVPEAARTFVRATWDILGSKSTHSIAAAFTFGREDLIPDMFRALVLDLDERFPNQLGLLRYYLERHIQLDEEHHTPLARRMVAALCETDQKKWREAEEAAQAALHARIALWDGVVEQITQSRRRGRE
jgi:FMN phosphatase YigB (HAD superfamily)